MVDEDGPGRHGTGGGGLSGVRAVIADDEVLLRGGLASLLEQRGVRVVGQAGDGPGTVAQVSQTGPDLVILDIRMPPTHRTEGLDVAREIRTQLPHVAIVVLSAHVEVDRAVELLASGQGVGYLLKQRVTDVAEFLSAVETVVRGGSVIDPTVVRELVSARRRDDPLEALTVREHAVLTLMAEGRSNAGIARQLRLSEGTVEKYVRGILRKLGIAEAEDDHRRVLAVLTYLERR